MGLPTRWRGRWRPLRSLAAGGLLVGAIARPAPTATIQYTADSVTDGVTGGVIGGSAVPGFELYGMGYVQRGDRLYVGFSTHLPIGGYDQSLVGVPVAGGSIAWGDLFLNFSGQSFDQALAVGDLYGIRFDAANDSGVPQLGLYRVTTVQSVTALNSGFDSLNQYITTVVQQGGTPDMGAVPLDGSYFNQTIAMGNAIATGTLLASDVTFIRDFSAHGFAADFGFGANLPATGAFTYGFSVGTEKLPLGEFVAHVFAECINDGLAFRGSLSAVRPPASNPGAAVPEPSMGIALGLVSCLGLRLRRRMD
ncbi:MAG: XDD3 family exosortase-dependent surface protein [Leptolyngbya sp.]|nr:XDD3 family exosortase-dependent surface protein [Leptolyngbya sp.]